MIQRSKLYITTIERGFSQLLRLGISEIIRDTPEEEKEERASVILNVVNRVETEQELIFALQEKGMLLEFGVAEGEPQNVAHPSIPAF